MITMSSEKFEELDDEVDILLDDLQRAVKNKVPKLGGEQRKAEFRRLDHMLEDAAFSIEAMTDEAEMAPATFRANMMGKIKDHRAKLDKLKKELNKSKGAAVGGGSELFDGTGPSDPAHAQRNRLFEGLDSLERGSASLERTQRVANETTEVGAGIISDLGEQRESLLRTRDRLTDTDQNLTKSRRILNSMAIKIATNKIILLVVVFLELAILAGVVYLKFFKK